MPCELYRPSPVLHRSANHQPFWPSPHPNRQTHFLVWLHNVRLRMRTLSAILLLLCVPIGAQAESPAFPKAFPERAAAEIMRGYGEYGAGVEFTLSMAAPRLASIKKGAVFEKEQIGKVYWAAKYTTTIHCVGASDSTGKYGVVLGDGEKYFIMMEDELQWAAEEERSLPNKRPEGTPGKSSPFKPSQPPGAPHP